METADLEHIDAVLARSLENIVALSDEMQTKLSEIKSCPKPCGDGTVNIFLSPGQAKKLPCPILTPDCHYGERMKQGLDRRIIEVMAGIGVPLRHLENFPERQETEETVEASRWSAHGFLIFTGEPGTGKSFGAALALYGYLKSQVTDCFDRGSWESAAKAGSSALWCAAMDIAEDRETASRAKRERLAVIDDLGGEIDTLAGQAAIRSVLLKRYDMKLPTMITTALTMLDIDLRYGSRITNRLTEDIGNGGRIIDCHGLVMHSLAVFLSTEGR